MDFERDEGSLEQLEYCETKVKERLEKVAEERSKSQGTSHEASVSNATGSHQGKKPMKRKVEETTAKWKHLEASPRKVQKVERSNAVPPPPGYVDKEDKEHDKMDQSPQVEDNRTVFVSNLDYEATEEDVRQALEPAGPITQFRMVKDFKGRSKGFCYVELTDEVCCAIY